jgi:hypothetical protein
MHVTARGFGTRVGSLTAPAPSSWAVMVAVAPRMRLVAALMVATGRARASVPAQLETCGKRIAVAPMPRCAAVRYAAGAFGVG